MNKDIEEYLKLPYTIELVQDLGEGWFVRVRELSGCMSQGDTAEEALVMIQEAMSLWLEAALEDGLSIPEPRPVDDYSGKFVVRLPRSLHRELSELAEDEGVSLNQLVVSALAQAAGRAQQARSETRASASIAGGGESTLSYRLISTLRDSADDQPGHSR